MQSDCQHIQCTSTYLLPPEQSNHVWTLKKLHTTAPCWSRTHQSNFIKKYPQNQAAKTTVHTDDDPQLWHHQKQKRIVPEITLLLRMDITSDFSTHKSLLTFLPENGTYCTYQKISCFRGSSSPVALNQKLSHALDSVHLAQRRKNCLTTQLWTAPVDDAADISAIKVYTSWSNSHLQDCTKDSTIIWWR
jgi:hypothetical protein